MSARITYGLTLNDTLARLGWRTEPHRHWAKRIYDEHGTFIGAMTAGEVWVVLAERGLVEERP